MTQRLPDITSRIQGIRELGSVVNAMRGIAGARAQQARGSLHAVELYSAALSEAIACLLPILPQEEGAATSKTRVVILFAAEQGFAGAFNEHLLNAALPHLHNAIVFVIGTRGAALIAERDIRPTWTWAMPAHPASIPALADRVATELYRHIAAGTVGAAEVLFAHDASIVEIKRLFPLEPKQFQMSQRGFAPLLELEADVLLADLTADYIHAQLCDAALHAFAAENDARMAAMAAAHREIERQLAQLKARRRIVRQDEITAEIIELAAGETASRLQ